MRTFCGAQTRGGSSDADVLTFWLKNIRFFEIYGASARTKERGLSQCGHFSDKGVNFSRFCANVFYGRPRMMKAVR